MLAEKMTSCGGFEIIHMNAESARKCGLTLRGYDIVPCAALADAPLAATVAQRQCRLVKTKARTFLMLEMEENSYV